MSWVKKQRAVCLPESEPVLLFCGCVLCLFIPLLFASCCHFSDFPRPQRRPHQWSLLFCVNIPNASLFIYCISAVTKRCCQGCAKHATMGKDNTDHNTRLEREMLSLTLSSCSVCLSPSQKGFCFRLCNVKKIIISYCHTLLTASREGAGGL